MSYFNNLTLTTKGQEMLLSSNMNIDKIITFTNASLGSEKLLPDEIKGATEIKSSWLKFPLNTVRIINDESNYFLRTEIAFTNAGIIENKIMRELGIYAKFENEEEALFAYSTTDDDGETIPKEDIVPATYKFTIDTTISTETKINQTLSPEGFLTKEVIELLKENIRNIAFRKIQGTLTANQKVIQVPTDILLPISQRAILQIEGEIYFLGRDYTIDIHANTITLNGRYNFKEDTHYEIIDPLPATYVKEQIQEFIDDFKKLVSDSKIDFDKLKNKIYLEFQEKVDSFYLELNEFIEQNKENLKGHSIDRIVENGKDENGGNIYNIFRDDNKNIGTMVAPRGLRGNGIVNPNYKGKNENGDTLYSWILEDGTETTETTIMPKGENGKSFYIAKIYPSIIEMRADFETDNIDFGEFVLISSEDSDNGKLFEKTTEEFKFIVDMGGANNTLKPATTNELGGVKQGENIKIEDDGTISAFSLPVGSIVKYPLDEINDIEFKKLNGEILESSNYPQLVGILPNAQYEYRNIPRRELINNNDDQLIISLIKNGEFEDIAYQTFGENAIGINYALFNKYVGIKLDARNADYILEHDETKHDPYESEMETTIYVRVEVKKIGYSVGIFGGEDGLQRIYSSHESDSDKEYLEVGEHILAFRFLEPIEHIPLLKRTPLTFRIFHSEGDISTNTSSGFTVDSARIYAIWIESSIRYNGESSLKYLMLPKEKMTISEKINQFGYDFNEYMFVGEAISKDENSYNFYSYNNEFELIGEIPSEIAVKNEIPHQIEGITLSAPTENRNGYTNIYNRDLDKWLPIKTHENKEGYYYDSSGNLKHSPKPSDWVKWDFKANTWIEDVELKEKAKSELLDKYIELEMKKDKMLDLKLNTAFIVEEIEKIKKNMEELNG